MGWGERGGGGGRQPREEASEAPAGGKGARLERVGQQVAVWELLDLLPGVRRPVLLQPVAPCKPHATSVTQTTGQLTACGGLC